MVRRQVFVGTFVHSKSRTELDYLHDSVVCVDEHGVIVKVERGCGAEATTALLESLGWPEAEVDVVACKEGQFFFPGFIGTFFFFFAVSSFHGGLLHRVYRTTEPRLTSRH